MLHRSRHLAVRYLRAVPRASIASTVFLLASGLALGLVFSTGLAHPFDKLFHGVFFALLTVSVSGFFGGRMLPAAALAALMGCGGEGVQALLPHHEASLLDAGANMIGILAAACAVRFAPAMSPSLWRKLGFVEVELATSPVPGASGQGPRG